MTYTPEKRIRRADATVTEFGAALTPALRVEPGEPFLVEMQDNFFGKIKSDDDCPTPETIPLLGYQVWKANPVAGPIHVEGLRAGDILVLEIEDIQVADTGWTGFIPPFGNLANRHDFPELQRSYVRITHHAEGTGSFRVNRDVRSECQLRRRLETTARNFGLAV